MEGRISWPKQAAGHHDEDTPVALKRSDCSTSAFDLQPDVVAEGRLWGETRYSSGSTPTTTIRCAQGFTGQRDDATIRLYFYNAR